MSESHAFLPIELLMNTNEESHWYSLLVQLCQNQSYIRVELLPDQIQAELIWTTFASRKISDKATFKLQVRLNKELQTITIAAQTIAGVIYGDSILDCLNRVIEELCQKFRNKISADSFKIVNGGVIKPPKHSGGSSHEYPR